MSSVYKEKIYDEIESLPEEMMPKMYRIIHVLKNELLLRTEKFKTRGSLRAIWEGSKIDDDLIEKAKKSLFPYDTN